MRYRCSNKVLAITRPRDGARRVISISAGTDDGRITNSSRPLVCHSTGGSRRRQIAISVQGHSAHRSMPILLRNNKLFTPGAAMFVGLLDSLQRVPALLCKEVFLIYKLDSLLFGEGLRARAVEHHMRGFFHHQPGKTDWILNPLHAGHSSGLKCLAVHYRGV